LLALTNPLVRFQGWPVHLCPREKPHQL